RPRPPGPRQLARQPRRGRAAAGRSRGGARLLRARAGPARARPWPRPPRGRRHPRLAGRRRRGRPALRRRAGPLPARGGDLAQGATSPALDDRRAGRAADATAHGREAAAILEKPRGPEHTALTTPLDVVATALSHLDRRAETRDVAHRWATIVEHVKGPSS